MGSRTVRRKAERSGQRGAGYLITGLLLGAALGLAYAWAVNPVRYVDAAPAQLSEQSKDQYRSLAALAYQANGDLGRARARLALLDGAGEAPRRLAAQAQRYLAGGGMAQEARALAQLAADLNQQPQGVSSPAETQPPGIGSPPLTPTLDQTQAVRPPADLTPVNTPLPTFTPRATRQPLVAPLAAPFTLQDRQEVCDPDLLPALLQVEVTDKDGKPLPGVRLEMTWEGGKESFFTGLYPRISLGYADFEMDAGHTYTLQAGEGGELVGDLTVTSCQTSDGEKYMGGWRLRFTLP